MKKHFAKQIFAAALAISFVCGLSACREREEEQLSLKPVIYLYPEEETDVSVTLAYDGTLTCTYPNYKTGWHVSAKPDGTLTDEDGQTYNYLYWEGTDSAEYDLSRGFCVAGSDTAAFLENALRDLGLTRKEANEFIVYWLPRCRKIPIISSRFSPTAIRRWRSWISPPRPTRSFGSSWRGNRLKRKSTFPRKRSPLPPATASQRWNGAAAA